MCIRYMESDSHLMEHLPMNEKVTRALNRLLRPLVRILYTNGIAFKDFTGLLKCVYIDVVGEDLVAAGEKPTTARIAILTGLTRKDVAELRKQDATFTTLMASQLCSLSVVRQAAFMN